jgi:hypothetical protein
VAGHIFPRPKDIEFLSRCCARVSQMMKKSEQELSDNAQALEDANIGRLHYLSVQFAEQLR